MSALEPLMDLSGGVQLADREGVFAHSFKCRRCTLHFVTFSWSETRHTPDTISCPECRASGDFMHQVTQLSDSRQFRMDPGRLPEIYDVWPFRVR
ncbi:MAG: hypothetical protein ACXWWX_04895 [Actinomycetota bacterium]